MKIFRWENFDSRVWQILTNLWTFATMGFFVVNFFSGDRYSTSSTAIAIIYTAILGIYASAKEFDRWQNSHSGKRLGELFVVLWTALMLFFIITATISYGKYRIPSEFSATYIAVLSIFALTQKSKHMHKKRG